MLYCGEQGSPAPPPPLPPPLPTRPACERESSPTDRCSPLQLPAPSTSSATPHPIHCEATALQGQHRQCTQGGGPRWCGPFRAPRGSTPDPESLFEEKKKIIKKDFFPVTSPERLSFLSFLSASSFVEGKPAAGGQTRSAVRCQCQVIQPASCLSAICYQSARFRERFANTQRNTIASVVASLLLPLLVRLVYTTNWSSSASSRSLPTCKPCLCASRSLSLLGCLPLASHASCHPLLSCHCTLPLVQTALVFPRPFLSL